MTTGSFTFRASLKFLLLPLSRIPKLREAQAGHRFAFCREKLVHQPFFMRLERVEFLGLRGDHVIEGSQAVGDFLLFFFYHRNSNRDLL